MVCDENIFLNVIKHYSDYIGQMYHVTRIVFGLTITGWNNEKIVSSSLSSQCT